MLGTANVTAVTNKAVNNINPVTVHLNLFIFFPLLLDTFQPEKFSLSTSAIVKFTLENKNRRLFQTLFFASKLCKNFHVKKDIFTNRCLFSLTFLGANVLCFLS
jgi:hypothetical protein